MNSILIGVSIFVALVILYLLAIMPRMFHRADDKAFKGWFFAHRGLYNNKSKAPENSIQAFENAIENYYGIELDVQLTKDEVIVVFHDYSILRMCGVDRNIYDMTYEELCQYTLLKSNCKIPRFDEVLRTINGKVPVIVELKLEYNYKRTCELVNAMLSTYKGVYCVQSFNPLGMLWYRIHNKAVMRGQLATMFFKDKKEGNKFWFFLMQNLLFNWLAKPDFISYKYKYRKCMSFYLCSKVYKPYTFAWTVRSEQERSECEGYFDYIIFERFCPKSETVSEK
ncbi:glycerophosphodiester phosphodiesterase family protein [Anaerosporobacter sp.]|uniref:glycerophosphodiester phosphodiesterase family protein n=1 Tax=Anaerosporobacter sp. TaxID=1872529 RepID=UPI00286F509A|nr:glycerophosphodiester phosphodiesterase family protein [Anaerosporobacter sp.]